MLQIILFQVIVATFIGFSIFTLSWLFPVEHKSNKKSKANKTEINQLNLILQTKKNR